MSKKYVLEKTIYDRYAIWYMETPKDRSKLGVWKIIDLNFASRPVKFAFKWKVKGKEKTQEELDNQILINAIKNFKKGSGNKFRGTRYEEQKNLA